MDWIMKYYFDCLIGISLIAAFILGLRFFLGKKLSKGYLYGLWILIPVFMLLAPFVHIPAPAFFRSFTILPKSNWRVKSVPFLFLQKKEQNMKNGWKFFRKKSTKHGLKAKQKRYRLTLKSPIRVQID